VKEVLDCFKHTDGCLLGITTDHASSNYLMTRELQSTLEASRLECAALRNHIPCMVHIIQLASSAFLSSLGVKGHTKSWEAHERDQQIRENECIHIRKSHRLQKEGNARFDKVSPTRPGLAKIIEKVRISRDFESPESDLHIAVNACCIDYTDTRSSKLVLWLLKSQSTNHGNTDYGWEDNV